MAMRTIRVGSVLLVVLGLLIAACGAPAATSTGRVDATPTAPGAATPTLDDLPDGDPIEIGLVTPLTGILAATGVRSQRGLQLAVDDINAQGGVAGRQIVLIEEDAGESPDAAITALRRVLDRGDPVALMGPVFGTFNLGMSELILESEIPELYTSGTADLDETGNPWMFGLHPSDRIRSAALARYAVETLGAQRVAVQYVNNAYGQGALEIVESVLEGTGAEVVSAESHEAADRDMSAQLRRHLEADADALLMWTFSPDGAVIIRQLAELDFTGVRIGASTIGLPEILDLVPAPLLDGWYGEVAAFLVGNDDPSVQEWVERYEERYNELPSTFDALSYDGGMMVAEALESLLADNPNASVEDLRTGIRDYLAGISYRGLATTYEADDIGRLSHCFVLLQLDAERNYQLVDEEICG